MLRNISNSDEIEPLPVECRAAYPHLLLTGSLNDPRVGYWGPAKFTAKMRANKLGNRLLLLKVRQGLSALVPRRLCHVCNRVWSAFYFDW